MKSLKKDGDELIEQVLDLLGKELKDHKGDCFLPDLSVRIKDKRDVPKAVLKILQNVERKEAGE